MNYTKCFKHSFTHKSWEGTLTGLNPNFYKGDYKQLLPKVMPRKFENVHTLNFNFQEIKRFAKKFGKQYALTEVLKSESSRRTALKF